MCEPVSLSMMAVGAASTLFQFQQQREAAEAANEAAEIQHDIEVKRAKEEAKDRQNQLSQEALEESQRISQQRQQLALQALQEASSARVASAESGTGGVSKIRSFLAADIGADLARSDIEKNVRNAQFNVAQRARGIGTAKNTRTENAFLTRQANTRRKPGIGDLAAGLAGNSLVQGGIEAGASKLFKTTGGGVPTPEFKSGQTITGARKI